VDLSSLNKAVTSKWAKAELKEPASSKTKPKPAAKLAANPVASKPAVPKQAAMVQAKSPSSAQSPSKAPMTPKQPPRTPAAVKRAKLAPNAKPEKNTVGPKKMKHDVESSDLRNLLQPGFLLRLGDPSGAHQTK